MEEESPPIEHENPFRESSSEHTEYSARSEETFAATEGLKRRKRPDPLTVLPKSAKSRDKIMSTMARRMAKDNKHPFYLTKQSIQALFQTCAIRHERRGKRKEQAGAELGQAKVEFCWADI